MSHNIEKRYQTLRITGGVLREVEPRRIWQIVEQEVTEHPIVGFSVQQSTGNKRLQGKQALLVAYGGRNTFPVISDPSQELPGVTAVDIKQKRLVYGPKGTNPLDYRDSYRHTFPPIQYESDADLETVATEFVGVGYRIHVSHNLSIYTETYDTDGEVLNLDEFLNMRDVGL